MSERPVRVMRPMDPMLFDPLQFHTRYLLLLSKSCMWSWFYERTGISFPGLVRKHHQGLVAVECDVEYVRPFGLFDSDEFCVSVERVRARQGNSVLELFHEFSAQGQVFAKVRMLWRMLELDGDQALTGAPGVLRDSVLQRLEPCEIDPSRELRQVEVLRTQVEGEGEKIGEGHYPFTLYRHLCEVADQWSFLEVPGLASAGRERLIDALEQDPFKLRATLGRPLGQVLVKISCPFYLFEEGEVKTTAFSVHGRLVFVHRVINLTRMSTLAAVVIETFQD
ncbi:hypothetical protein [Pseudomonas rubra]|uniref:Acyl-CoA thioesterase FadM n=1 Tax=Pseudomonas rubra TaxID=2942627 RepID=A0ABT5PFS8_9PSED|nr:hypothetical protein [Pseudomonas rubra]MDD1017050.1 hypothetical protein [Pseudomonas rubra]MDD1037109.1 hypothetical protein [Pseudomonas rubra]MDD1153770.1 hypothetical protein [Pseudomonas rubra]